MVPWNHFSIHQNLLEEVEKIADVDQLKQIAANLIKENSILSRRTNTALKSLENQNTLIKYLQGTLNSMMKRNKDQVKELWAVLGTETFRMFDNVLRYQTLLHNMEDDYKFEEQDQRLLTELSTAALLVPFDTVVDARGKCAEFLLKLKNRGFERIEVPNIEIPKVNTIHKERPIDNKFQNDGRNTLERNRKQNYRIKAKKNACKTSRKNCFNKLQNDKSDNRGRKNSRYSKLANSGKSHVQPKKFPQKQRLKKKTEGENDVSCLNFDNENLKSSQRRRFKRKAEETNNDSLLNFNIDSTLSDNKASMTKTVSKKKMKISSDYSTSYSSNEPIKLKNLVIKLSDFMIDPYADNDQYIAQYKQAYEPIICMQGNEEIEYEVVDDIDSDQRAESDHNSDNDEDDRISTKSHASEDDNISTKSHASEDNIISTKSHASEDNIISTKSHASEDNIITTKSHASEDIISTKSHLFKDNNLAQHSIVSKSAASEDSNDAEQPGNAVPNGKKGPCTPPLSPAPDDYIFRRGPRTPPPAALTSDSEAIDDDDESSDSTSSSTF